MKILEKKAEWVQGILAAIQFRMLRLLICRTDIFPVILCGCEIWCLPSQEERRLRVCESRVGRRIFYVRGSYEWRDAEDSVVSFISVTVHQILLM